jgi:ribose transport system substrate-binding protein
MGQLGVEMMVRLLNGETIPEKIDTGTGLVTPDKLAMFTMTPAEELKPAKPYKIAFVDCLNTTVFWISMEDAMKARAKNLGVDLTVVAPSRADVTEQTGLIEDLIQKKVEALILGTCDSKGIVPVVEKANAAGIPVIAVDTAIDGGKIASLIQTNNIKGAEMAAEYIAQDLKGKGKVLVIDGNLVHQTGRDRARVGSYLKEKYPDVKVVQQPGNWTQAEGMAVAENVLTANPDVNWIFTAADPMAMGAIQAVQAAGLQGKVKIMGFDANPESIDAIKKGTMHAEIAQYPKKMGSVGLDMAVRVLNGEQIPATYDTGTGLITPADVK